MKKITIFRQVLAAFPIYSMMFVTGNTIGWLPFVIYDLRSADTPTPITANQGAWVVSCQQLGRLMISIPAGILTEQFGKKTASLTAGTIFVVTWFFISVNTSLNVLYVLSFSLGVALGYTNTMSQTYLAELVSAEIRGSMFAWNSFFYNSGALCISLLGIYLSYRKMCLTMWCITVVYFCTLYWLTESPYYLLNKNRDVRAMEVLNWLRLGCAEEKVTEEFGKMAANIESQKRYGDKHWNILKALKSSVNRKRLAVVLILNFLITFTGQAAIRIYSVFIFPETGLLKAVHYPFAISCIQLVFSLIAPFFMDRINRRTLFIGSSVINGIILALCSFGYYYLAIADDDATFRTQVAIFITAAILLYYALMTAALNLLICALRGEYLPQSIKGIGTGTAVISQSISVFTSIFLFNWVTNSVGMYANFAIFSFNSFLVAIMVYFTLPETRGKALADIHNEMYQTKDRAQRC